MTPRVPILGSGLEHSSRLSPPPEGPEESFWKPVGSPDSGAEPDVLGRAVPSGEKEQQSRGCQTGADFPRDSVLSSTQMIIQLVA